MHEILTLQLGHRANYLASHFWNVQESYFTYDTNQQASPVDHDVHFRAGVGPSGEDTFTPRTLIYDLKGGFGALRKWGGLYEQDYGTNDVKSLWSGNIVEQREAAILPSEYQKDLDSGVPTPRKPKKETVRFWSDFARTFYHPRSILQINDYELGSTIMPFERWEGGEDLYDKLDKEHDILDRDIRVWAEECDQMQGFQIFTSADDAWGGFSSKYVENLRDEFGKASIWTWGLEEETGQVEKAKTVLRTVNIAKTLQDILLQTSMYVPLTVSSRHLPPYVELDENSQWQLSGLLSLAVESMTLPSRLRHQSAQRGNLGDIEAVLNVNGNQRIANLQCTLDDDSSLQEADGAVSASAKDSRVSTSDTSDLALEDELQEPHLSLDIDFTNIESGRSGISIRQWERKKHVFASVHSLRGSYRHDGDMIDEDEAAFLRKRRRFASLPVVERHYSPLKYPIVDSFPNILSDQLAGLDSIAVHTSLSTTYQISGRIKGLQSVVGRVGDMAEREAISNRLGEIAEAYQEGWDSGSGDDSDE
ncbi:MAG: hypothetical protein Q9214_002243 [Letrouitia sp. 1 TL-2023]